MKNFNSMRRFVIGFIMLSFVFTIGCTNNRWGNGYEVVPSDETISQDSIEVLIKNLDD